MQCACLKDVVPVDTDWEHCLSSPAIGRYEGSIVANRGSLKDILLHHFDGAAVFRIFSACEHFMWRLMLFPGEGVSREY